MIYTMELQSLFQKIPKMLYHYGKFEGLQHENRSGYL
jgi:hypothetical protein